LQEQMDRWLEPQRRLQEQMDRWLEPQRRLQEQISKWIAPLHHLLDPKQPLKMATFVDSILTQIDLENIKVSESGTISVEGNIFSAKEVSDIYGELIVSIAHLPSPAQVLDAICLFFDKLKKPMVTLLLIIILPFIINVTSNLSTCYFEEIISDLTNKSKREKTKIIKQDAQRHFDADLLRQYRFVTANVLRVRKGPSQKSQVIDELYFGKVVSIIEKGRQWSAIEYMDEDKDQKVNGWVFNRYLAKFEK